MDSKLESRQFFTWGEAAEVLGFDSEGLRQAMLGEMNSPASDKWLPVGVDARGDDFLTHLASNEQIRVVEPCLNYDEHGVERNATFDDGSMFESAGKTFTASWEATHDHRSGWSMCFLLGGRVVLDPHTVRGACQDDGDLRRNLVCLAPREWWHGGTTKHYFVTIGGDFALGFRKPPENIYRDTFFYANDVFRIAKMLGKPRRSSILGEPASGDKWPWGSHETELLGHLAAAASEWWSTYDSEDPSTAPKNKEVVNWLSARGVSKRNAEIIATMLRPTTLRPGPR
jgi:hypothetical protein